jgi:hypothetical protein
MLPRNVLSEVDVVPGQRPRYRALTYLHLCALALLLTLEAHAAGVAGGAALATFDLRENGWAVICVDITKHGPACGVANDNCFAFDTQTDRGRSMQSLITAAFLAGRKADLFGTDTCNADMPDVEQLARFVMH